MAVVGAITPIAPSHKAADVGCVVGGGDASSESTARERGFAKYSVATLQMGDEAAVGAIATDAAMDIDTDDTILYHIVAVTCPANETACKLCPCVDVASDFQILDCGACHIAERGANIEAGVITRGSEIIAVEGERMTVPVEDALETIDLVVANHFRDSQVCHELEVFAAIRGAIIYSACQFIPVLYRFDKVRIGIGAAAVEADDRKVTIYVAVVAVGIDACGGIQVVASGIHLCCRIAIVGQAEGVARWIEGLATEDDRRVDVDDSACVVINTIHIINESIIRACIDGLTGYRNLMAKIITHRGVSDGALPAFAHRLGVVAVNEAISAHLGVDKIIIRIIVIQLLVRWFVYATVDVGGAFV